jgi:hypothetical protein
MNQDKPALASDWTNHYRLLSSDHCPIPDFRPDRNLILANFEVRISEEGVRLQQAPLAIATHAALRSMLLIPSQHFSVRGRRLQFGSQGRDPDAVLQKHLQRTDR